MTTIQVTAFCPGHISGYFKPVITDEPATSGSYGGGIVIDSGVTVVTRQADETSVQVFKTDSMGATRQVADDSPVIRNLLQNLQVTASVKTFCTLPLSAGYGLSAAALLGTMHAINRLYNLGLSPKDCATHAHQEEVSSRTGLGDISACQGGGWVVRRGPGISADIVRYQNDQTIYALTLGPLKTVSVLSSPDIIHKIMGAFPSDEPDDFNRFFICARNFAEASGLISPEIRKVLIACDANHIPASMTMLGNGVFALGENAKEILNQYGEVFSLHTAQAGPRILEELP